MLHTKRNVISGKPNIIGISQFHNIIVGNPNSNIINAITPYRDWETDINKLIIKIGRAHV